MKSTRKSRKAKTSLKSRKNSPIGVNSSVPARTLPLRGDTDYISRASFPSGTEPFLDAAFSAEIGQFHDGVIGVEVQGESYYMIFRKDEARDEYQKPFEEEDVRRSVIRKAEREKTAGTHGQLGCRTARTCRSQNVH